MRKVRRTFSSRPKIPRCSAAGFFIFFGRISGFAPETGLWNALAFQCSNSSAPSGLPVFPLQSLALLKNGIQAIFEQRSRAGIFLR
jgi:hypothetical protein